MVSISQHLDLGGEDVDADEEKIDEAVNWIQQDPPAGISGAPYDNNIMLSNAVILRSLHKLLMDTAFSE
ncbi:hypothetical protein KY290_030535 [Solanum tuberosum]|uniref:Uncharacterized protein n=1 Tax=Solanum tuberosum TaxID=4113 RepID=A0ABQ7U6I9_SOLTU|nr:hypothetical protein KY284_029554 [Solanum tuberosum]KAH0742542.1 hypothetical protein KY290_030535 [Solanum tuberosum]